MNSKIAFFFENNETKVYYYNVLVMHQIWLVELANRINIFDLPLWI